MNQIVLFVGFSVIAGLLAGYMTARLGSRRMVWALWGVSGSIVIGAVLWSGAAADRAGLESVLLVYGILLPFAGCAIVAGILGLAVRRILARTGSE